MAMIPEGGAGTAGKTSGGGTAALLAPLGIKPAPTSGFGVPWKNYNGVLADYGNSNFSPAPAPKPPASGGGGGGGGSYGGGGGIVAPVSAAPLEAQAPPPPSQTDFLNSDDVYLAALSRYNQQFKDLGADITRRQGDYQQTYDNGLSDLGYVAGLNGAPNTWDWGNEQTAAGRGYQALIQDFAARGLLHSGDYLRSQDNLQSNLAKQFTGMQNALSQFNEGLNSERTQGQTARDNGIGQARADALARYAAQYGAV